MFSLPSLDSSISHTRDTSDKRQLPYTFARFFFCYLVDCPVFFFFRICENELSWCFAHCSISQFVTERLCVFTQFSHVSRILTYIFFIKMFFFRAS